jgi:hypothetical protein
MDDAVESYLTELARAEYEEPADCSIPPLMRCAIVAVWSDDQHHFEFEASLSRDFSVAPSRARSALAVLGRQTRSQGGAPLSHRGRRLLIEPLTSEGAKVYPSFLASGIGDHELELAACRAG